MLGRRCSPRCSLFSLCCPNDCWRGNCSLCHDVYLEMLPCSELCYYDAHMILFFFVQYSLPLLILLKFPTWSYIILSRRHCQVPQVHDIEMFFLLFGWFPNHVGVVYVPMEKILGDNPISVFCSVCQTTIYTGLPLHRNMSSHIIIKWEKCLLFFTKNSINHLLYTLRGFHKILNLFV